MDYLDKFTCELMVDLTVFKSDEVVSISDVSLTVDEPAARECEGWAKLYDGNYEVVLMRAQRNSDGSIESGFQILWER